MVQKKNIQLAFYGDDFTGSTDALEFICRAGAKAILFIEPPTGEELERFPGLDAYGIAGKTRSLSPGEMEQVLVPAFLHMKASGAAHLHYKVCSTFDSSSSVGSIGKAIDCGAAVFNNKTIPVLGGTPALGRYCVFGNLFARLGTGKQGKVYRIDRHPSMSKHPVTPADESDLRLHLGKQTSRKIGLIDIKQQEEPIEEWTGSLQNDEEIALLDVLHETQLAKIGAWLEAQRKIAGELFSIGSSSLEMALGKYWNSQQLFQPTTNWKSLAKANPLLVVSGSCSPVTTSQIENAKANGFEEVELDATRISREKVIEEKVMDQIIGSLQGHRHLIVHTGLKQPENLSSEKLGTALGTIAKQAVKRTGIKRVVIAGGDTSSYAARAMQIDAVEMIAPLVPGAPLCRAYSKDPSIEGLEMSFKGGQVGGENYFTVLMNGG
ncbi:MAG TPA: four-carbon acid sugar kinase family protein [Chitinophagaceae bacterium]|nr:four-carbon acid sugar kinase family protein [Chitinophagaceae bacterium]HEX5653431.1 four-carbon acid sugar kinase family protein [Chitinophagaceae bacterium]